jgi:MFS family permease
MASGIRREFPGQQPNVTADEAWQARLVKHQLSPIILRLGFVSLLTAMSSAMVYGLLPVFLVKSLGVTAASVGLIEGIAEATTSFVKVISGIASDWTGRRKPLVVIGYTLSAVNKLVFPLAGAASVVLIARVFDRVGKGIRDAPRDAFMTDVTPVPIRGRGFGLRLAFYTVGFVLGPAAAIAIMRLSGDDFRLTFWVAVIPAILAIAVVVGLKEMPWKHADGPLRLAIRPRDLKLMPPGFWWAIAVASLLSLARFSPAFLVLKAHDVGVDAAFVPAMLIVMHLVYSAVAYPFGILADRIDRRLQLILGAGVLMLADLMLASAAHVWLAALGAGLWGLQMGITQGLLAATVADAAPGRLRGTAFGIYEVAVGIATFLASAGAGLLWTTRGASTAYAVSAIIAVLVTALLLYRRRAHPHGF